MSLLRSVAGPFRSLSGWQTILATVLAALPFVVLARRRGQRQDQYIDAATNEHDAEVTDPGLLKKHSTCESYTVPATGYTYKSIRAFYRAHPQADKLPNKPFPLPLLVFIHGLGGSAAQWAPLLTSMVNCGPCLAIDLPGCGRSEFSPRDWEAYSTEALTQLLAVVIERHRDAANGQRLILFGHSLGCSLAARLASPVSKDLGEISPHVIGFVALCPRISPLTKGQESGFYKLLHIPTPVFNLWRKWDRQGGRESKSVHRFVGESAEKETKKLQLRFNEQSKTDVWRRMAYGNVLPERVSGFSSGLADEKIWAGIDMPVLLIGGEADTVTSPEEVKRISQVLKDSWGILHENSSSPLSPSRIEDGSVTLGKPPHALKTTILPPPASHALLFAPSTVRIISGLIHDYLAAHVDRRLSLGFQLQHLSTEGKWDVKNLAKWEKVRPVSPPIAGVFRAMKTMREVDEKHCPKEFAKEWAGKVRAVVDISHESPVYDPAGLEAGGIQYYKFPTVSKLPPSEDEVHSFIDLIDRLRSETKSSGQEEPENEQFIAVHCHYGYNRTGFFIVGYLIERLGWNLMDAVQEFADKRPPGIRHEYFVDALYVRYGSPGMRRASTIK